MTQTKKELDKNKLSIESLRETITSAEKTIQSAKAMLLQLEGKKRVGRKKKIDADEEGAVYGTFDGQIMIGNDGKQYPVPANYASKSKLVEGDMLKLVIDNGVFLYKQVGPIERKNLIGIAGQDESGNYFVLAEGKPYKILLASITYFKIEPGDEVVITIPADGDSTWAAVENVLQKNDEEGNNVTVNNQKIASAVSDSKNKEPVSAPSANTEYVSSANKTSFDAYDKRKEMTENDNKNESTANTPGFSVDDWMSDIEEIKKEIQKERIATD